jgi:Lon protease-like protein
MSDEHSSLAGFAGSARLFPLPNLVLFPHVMQPLHIFETRYRDMTAEALAGDRLIAMVLLRPGWEADYAGNPAIHDFACLGKIVADQKVADGRYNILLRGLSRIRIVRELQHDKLFRKAQVELVSETSLPGSDVARKLRRRLNRLVPIWFPAQGGVLEQFRKLLRSQLPLGALCDIITFALPFEVEFKQALLAQANVTERVHQLLGFLSKREPPEPSKDSAAERKFPPEFSVN